MSINRRQFLSRVGSGVASLGGLAGLARAAQLPATDIRLDIRGHRGRQGAELALDEMTRTASMLDRRIVLEPGEWTVLLDEGALEMDGRTYHVPAQPSAREEAVARWKDKQSPAADAAVEWHPDLVRFGAEQLNERFSRRFHDAMQADAWIAWMLVRIPVDVGLRGMPITEASFDGHKGVALTFDADGWLQQPLCIVDRTGALLGTTS